MGDKKKHSLETMTGAGKEIELVGRKYLILPVNIEDMKYVIGENEEERLIIPTKSSLEDGSTMWSVLGLNMQGTLKKVFLKIINKYVYYLNTPMTEEMLIEHNWSFKEIGKFLLFWVQEVSE